MTLIWHFFNKILKFIQYNNLYLQGEDLVPEPKIIIAALHACRRVSDYALAIRYLEAIHVSSCIYMLLNIVYGDCQG